MSRYAFPAAPSAVADAPKAAVPVSVLVSAPAPAPVPVCAFCAAVPTLGGDRS
ncbi:hypothetical protein [Streptomyces showdoensis]|uniref:hypothetical protein n=1 Tax=Streptomyces showdoensis TaxID=68268 RepID=UPI0013F4EDDE|nr:hypothetical protein [Streptomyces showdoensis]